LDGVFEGSSDAYNTREWQVSVNRLSSRAILIWTDWGVLCPTWQNQIKWKVWNCFLAIGKYCREPLV